MKNSPKFIVFEGIDGAGKTTQINLLREALEVQGIPCQTTAEPTALPSGKLLRRALSGELEKTPLQMAELFAQDREAHNSDPDSGIEAILQGGKTLISDRYYYSSLAYQGTTLGYDIVAKLNLENPKIRRPDLCVFLDLTPEQSLSRIGKRGEQAEIYENLEYLTKTRSTFFEVFEKLRKRGENIVVIDASGSIKEVAEKILSAVMTLY